MHIRWVLLTWRSVKNLGQSSSEDSNSEDSNSEE